MGNGLWPDAPKGEEEMSIKTFRYEKQHNYADKNIRARLLEEIQEHPGCFSSEHEYGCVNIIGKAKERKDLHCVVRLNDLSFFSAAKQIIRKLCGVCSDAEARAEKAEAERNWLAAELAELHDASLMLVDGAPEGSNRLPYWLKLAEQKAVKSMGGGE